MCALWLDSVGGVKFEKKILKNFVKTLVQFLEQIVEMDVILVSSSYYLLSLLYSVLAFSFMKMFFMLQKNTKNQMCFISFIVFLIYKNSLSIHIFVVVALALSIFYLIGLMNISNSDCIFYMSIGIFQFLLKFS